MHKLAWIRQPGFREACSMWYRHSFVVVARNQEIGRNILHKCGGRCYLYPEGIVICPVCGGNIASEAYF